MRIRDPGWRQFGSWMEKSRIRDKHPGSATLLAAVRDFCFVMKSRPDVEFVSGFGIGIVQCGGGSVTFWVRFRVLLFSSVTFRMLLFEVFMLIS
jgi:hypothetical protein